MYGLIKICLQNLSQFQLMPIQIILPGLSLISLSWPVEILWKAKLIKSPFYNCPTKHQGGVHRGWCAISKIWSGFPSKIKTMVFCIRYVWIIKKWHLVLCIKYVWLIKNLKSGPWYVLLSVYGLIFFHFLVQCMI